VSEVIASARPLNEMLWQRETEGGGFDTPERRAGLDRRVAEVTNAIADPSVRKYYRQDLEERVAGLFAPIRAEQAKPPLGKPRKQQRPAGRMRDRGPQASAAGGTWRSSVDLRPGARSFAATAPRSDPRGTDLQAVINHPWLLDTHAEELAALEFRHPDGDKLRAAILDAAASEHPLTPAAMRAAIACA
jgi:DNA primase